MKKMKLLLSMLVMLVLCSCGEPSSAATMVYSADGKSVVTNRSLAALATAADCAGRKIVFTTDQTLTANLNWPADRELVPENGAKINHGAYTINYTGSTANWPMARIFNGTGSVNLGGRRAYPVWFGAVADGVVDDTAALQAAGGVADWGENKTYKINGQLTFSSNTDILGTNVTLKPTGAFTAIRAAGTYSSAVTTLASDVQVSQRSIPVTDASGLAAGDIIHLKSSALWYYDNRDSLYKGEMHKIAYIVGNTVYLSEPTFDAYKLPEETVTIYKITPIRVTLSGVSIVYPSNTVASGISLVYTANAVVSDVAVSNCTESGISLGYNYHTTITRYSAKSINGVELGYGIQDNGSLGTLISDSWFVGCRRGVDFSGTTPSRNGKVTGSYVSASGLASDGSEMYANSTGLGSHGPADSITFENNIIDNVRIAFYPRGSNFAILNNTLRGNINSGVLIDYGTDITIKGNVYRDGFTNLPAVSGSGAANFNMARFVEIYGNTSANGRIVIEGNTVKSLRVSFVNFSASLTAFPRLQIYNNDITLRSNSSSNSVYFIEAPSAIDLTYFDDVGNNIENFSGIYSRFAPAVSVKVDQASTGDFDRVGVTVQQWSGAGTLTLTSNGLIVSKRGKEVRLRGFLVFSAVGGAVGIKFTGLPQRDGAVPISTPFNRSIGVRGTVSSLGTGSTYTSRTELYLSPNETGTSDQFASGDYAIYIDVPYSWHY